MKCRSTGCILPPSRPHIKPQKGGISDQEGSTFQASRSTARRDHAKNLPLQRLSARNEDRRIHRAGKGGRAEGRLPLLQSEESRDLAARRPFPRTKNRNTLEIRFDSSFAPSGYHPPRLLRPPNLHRRHQHPSPAPQRKKQLPMRANYGTTKRKLGPRIRSIPGRNKTRMCRLALHCPARCQPDLAGPRVPATASRWLIADEKQREPRRAVRLYRRFCPPQSWRPARL